MNKVMASPALRHVSACTGPQDILCWAKYSTMSLIIPWDLTAAAYANSTLSFSLMPGQTGSFLNMAPEVVLGKQYDQMCDVSALPSSVMIMTSNSILLPVCYAAALIGAGVQAPVQLLY